MTYRKEWMTDDQYECYELLADLMHGFHHLPSAPKPWGEGICMNFPGSWATYDFNALTRVVLLAHDRMIRVEIAPCNMQLFRVTLHKRHTREGRGWERHPTIEEAIQTNRKERKNRV